MDLILLFNLFFSSKKGGENKTKQKTNGDCVALKHLLYIYCLFIRFFYLHLRPELRQKYWNQKKCKSVFCRRALSQYTHVSYDAQIKSKSYFYHNFLYFFFFFIFDTIFCLPPSFRFILFNFNIFDEFWFLIHWFVFGYHNQNNQLALLFSHFDSSNLFF